MSSQHDSPSSSSPVPSADAPAQQLPDTPPQKPAVKGKPKKEYRQIQMPSADQIVQEDMMNNCGVRTVMSGVMGMGLGVLFGVVMGTMDAGVSLFLDHAELMVSLHVSNHLVRAAVISSMKPSCLMTAGIDASSCIHHESLHCIFWSICSSSTCFWAHTALRE